mgnify:CR=1 FL=1
MTRSFIHFTAQNTAIVDNGPLPDQAAENQMIVRTHVSSISAGTERMWFEGRATALTSGRKSYPYQPGYASIGEVVSVGDGVEGYAVGDRVFYPKPHGDSHVIQMGRDRIFKISNDAPAQDVLLSTLLTTALNTVRRGRIAPGDKVAVVGFGLLGFLITQLLREVLVADVTVVARNPSRHTDLCAQLGATLTDQPDGVKAPIAIDTTGAQGGFNMACRAAASNGKVLGAGFYCDPISIDGEAFFTKELDILAVRAGGGPTDLPRDPVWSSASNLEYAVTLTSSGRIKADGLLTEHLTPQEALNWYADNAPAKRPTLTLIDWP